MMKIQKKVFNALPNQGNHLHVENLLSGRGWCGMDSPSDHMPSSSWSLENPLDDFDDGVSDVDDDSRYVREPLPKSITSLERLAARINLNDATSKYYATLSNPKHDKDRNQYTDRANRAVTEQVLDPRTRMILLKMINNNLIYQVNGCVSTGKEANVYHATGEQGQHYGLKIYKTTILTFKSREKYVTGEFRFRKGYSKHNPRKMVQLWAEKEFRNLKRLRVAGVPCPEPVFLKLHVMLMSFIGDGEGIAAPRLKDVTLTADRATAFYYQCIKIMRTMYQECKLVHADLSEYNLLCYGDKLIVIDVSQSVEHDHPHALDFLRHDCANIIGFFRQNHVQTLDLRQLFDFVTDMNISKDRIDVYLGKAHEQTSLDGEEGIEVLHKQQVDERVFSHAYIPRTLDEVIDIERDINQIHEGNTDELFYTKLTGIAIKEDRDESEKPGNHGSGDDSGSDSSSGFAIESKLSKEEIKQSRKENKVKVKAENREKRKHKTPKHVKKRRDKIAHQH